MSLNRVFQPIQIHNLEIPNRVVRAAHDSGFSRSAEISDQLIAYHLERAKGGVGLSILEVAAVHPTTRLSLRADDDSIIPGYRRLMELVRPTGMRVFQQLWHGGHHYPGVGDTVPWSASDVPSPNLGIVPMPMTPEQIEEVIVAFAAAAVRCRQGGIEGVELHAAHGYLFHQFLSPLTNHRTDDYGGSLGNRMRLLQETLRAVREAVGGDYPVGVRVSASTATGSLSEDELISVVRSLEAEHLIDFLNVSWGDYYQMDSVIGGMHWPAGYELNSSAGIAGAVSVPRIVTGRFRTLEEVEGVLRDGQADMVSMVRAHIADPALVRKTREGRVDEVRPCLGCNQGCLGGMTRTGMLGCTVNPAVGLEATLSEDLIKPAGYPKRLLVVGGGPAGMEAARIAALRGHRVVLAEASAHLGGAINVASRAPRLLNIGDATYWLESEVYRLGVEVRLNTFMDADDVLAEQADHVIIATGSMPRMDGVQIMNPGAPVPGVSQPHVISSVDLLTDPQRPLGTHAVVVDDIGHYEAVAVAEHLIVHDVAVTYVTRLPAFAPTVSTFNRASAALSRLYRGDFELLVRHHLVAVRPGECEVRPLQSSKSRVVRADTVVLVTANEPLRELHDVLRVEIAGLSLIGDAAAPRDLQAAIAEGHHAGRFFDVA